MIQAVRPLVHRALVADHEELFARIELLDPRKPAGDFLGLQAAGNAAR